MTPSKPGRRQFLGQSAALAAGFAALDAGRAEPVAAGVNRAAMPGLTDTSASPHAIVRSVGLSEVRWTSGFWADRFTTCRDTIVPNLWTVMDATQPRRFLHNLRVAAGDAEGRHHGPAWDDGDFYKWLEAAAAVSAVAGQREVDQQIDAAIAIIARAQAPDGYLHTPVLIRRRNGQPDAQPFQDPLAFETYNLGHLITAACVHHRATGKTSLLDLAIKAAAFLAQALKSHTAQLARCAVCPSHYMALVELYRTTRDPQHLALAQDLVALRDHASAGSDDNQDRIPLRRQTEAAGHAVRANYLYAGLADLVAETGDRSLLAPLLKIWESAVYQKMYVTGGCGALYDGASPDGAADQTSIARVHQAYGRAYQLPNSTAHNETCAAVASVLWNWRMLALTGEARFADVLELALYNAVLAGVSLDGTRFFYINTLRQLDTMPAALRWSRTREPFLSCFCCPPNLARTIAEATCYAYGKSDDALWVHLYGGSVLDTQVRAGARLKLTQETHYPWDGRVTITIDAAPQEPFALRLRVPGWSRGATIELNGRPWPPALEPATYAELRRAWSAGDRVVLDLPMPVRLLEAHPLVEEARNHAAIQRGPIVYCLESSDLPAGIRVPSVLVPASAELVPRYDARLLGGVTLLEGRAEARPARAWSKQLYRDLSRAPGRPIDLRLIPYYAWGNRGRSEMTVWMPRSG